MRSALLHDEFRRAQRRADIALLSLVAAIAATSYLLIVNSTWFLVPAFATFALGFTYEVYRDRAERVHAAYRAATAIEWGWASQERH